MLAKLLLFCSTCILALSSPPKGLSVYSTLRSPLKSSPKVKPLLLSLGSTNILCKNKVYKEFMKIPSPIQHVLLVNILVFICWQSVSKREMYNYFSYKGKTNGYYVNKATNMLTRLTSMFSHISLIHLYSNMKVLIDMGPTILRSIGDMGFLKLILMTSVTSSVMVDISRVITLSFRNRVDRERDNARPAVGFSAVNCALLVIFTVCCRSDTYFEIPFIENPIQPTSLLKSLIIFDLLGFLLQSTFFAMPLCHAAHLGGYLSGFLYYVYFMGRKVSSLKDVIYKVRSIFNPSYSFSLF